MNSVKAQVFTTVGVTAKTRATRTAGNIRIDGTLVADPDLSSVLWNVDDLSSQFMSQDTRIGINGVAPGKRMKITATDAHPANADQSFTGQRGRPWYLTFQQLTGRCQQNLPHSDVLLLPIV
jgi:hypothetical protein